MNKLTITWCGLTITWCGLTITWCGLTITWCGLTITWCGLKSPFEKFHKLLVSGNFNNFPLGFIGLTEHEYFFEEFSVKILIGQYGVQDQVVSSGRFSLWLSGFFVVRVGLFGLLVFWLGHFFLNLSQWVEGLKLEPLRELLFDEWVQVAMATVVEYFFPLLVLFSIQVIILLLPERILNQRLVVVNLARVGHPRHSRVRLNLRFMSQDLIVLRDADNLSNLLWNAWFLGHFAQLLNYVRHLFLVADYVQSTKFRFLH